MPETEAPEQSEINSVDACPTGVSEVLVIGLESVGKSQLISSLTKSLAVTGNFRGTTVSCDRYRWAGITIIDTPGILRQSDSETTNLALKQLETQDVVLVVLDATHLDRDIETLLPMVRGKRGAIVVTFWDKVTSQHSAEETLSRISSAAEMPFIHVDARELTEEQRNTIHRGILHPKPFPEKEIRERANWVVEAPRGILEIPILGPFVALNLLLLPAWVAVQNANSIADSLFGPISNYLKPWLASINTWPAPLNHVFGGNYGFVSMLPFLLLYALPTVLAFSVILAVYKASGLIDRLTVSLHPIIRPFGLAGRDLVRVIMGFGCNVPAVINSRSCSGVSRGTCVSAVCFGSACSYQLPATIAVFAAAGMSELTLPYLLILAVTTLIYLRFTSTKIARSPSNRLLISRTPFTQFPRLKSTLREAWGVMHQFLFIALPVFFGICLVASLLSWSGFLESLSNALGFVMVAFNLPSDASIPVILGSIRKDGIAIGLLDSDWNTLKVSVSTPAQVLTVVYLSGVLFPCLVTIFTVLRELKWKFALKTVAFQAAFALVFSLLIAWIGKIFFG